MRRQIKTSSKLNCFLLTKQQVLTKKEISKTNTKQPQKACKNSQIAKKLNINDKIIKMKIKHKILIRKTCF